MDTSLAFNMASLLWTLLFHPFTLSICVSVEVIFFVLFYLYLIPRANSLKPSAETEEYRDFGRDRVRLLKRILDRISERCEREGSDLQQQVEEFLGEWFICNDKFGPVKSSGPTRDTATVEAKEDGRCPSPNSSDDEWLAVDKPPEKSNAVSKSSALFRRGDIDNFFSWAFFGKESLDDEWERSELKKMYAVLFERVPGMDFSQPGTTHNMKPMRLTFDNVRATYRPLVVYGFIYTINLLGGFVLFCAGFRRHQSSSGLTFWFRDWKYKPLLKKEKRETNALPLLFFHGIAPGGLALYLPMILRGLGAGGRPTILFLNRPISFCPCFAAVDEDAYVSGVREAMDRHLGRDRTKENGVALMGHSFGSCNLTWMLRCPKIRQDVRQVVLLDPVSVMLSEPDVMTNFLYKAESVSFLDSIRSIILSPLYYTMDSIDRRPASVDGPPPKHSFCSYSSLLKGQSTKSGNANRIAIAQCELWIEHYLRRNFSWYNSELWLDHHVPKGVKVLLCISGKDEILNPRKVHEEAIRYQETSPNNVEIINWDDGGHGCLVSRPACWAQIASLMRRQEIQLSRSKKFR